MEPPPRPRAAETIHAEAAGEEDEEAEEERVKDLTLRVGRRSYRLSSFESLYQPAEAKPEQGPAEDRLALIALNDPALGVRLVPEHVETRPLYSPLQEGVEQVRFRLLLVCVELVPDAIPHTRTNRRHQSAQTSQVCSCYGGSCVSTGTCASTLNKYCNIKPFPIFVQIRAARHHLEHCRCAAYRRELRR